MVSGPPRNPQHVLTLLWLNLSSGSCLGFPLASGFSDLHTELSLYLMPPFSHHQSRWHPTSETLRNVYFPRSFWNSPHSHLDPLVNLVTLGPPQH